MYLDPPGHRPGVVVCPVRSPHLPDAAATGAQSLIDQQELASDH
jgi:hypothetical protein